MFSLLIGSALAITQVDGFCREHFGHPGDLGVTEAAERHFRSGSTYPEIVATIGAWGEELPSNDASLKAYRWENGKLEMHFRNNRLRMYRMGGQWKVVDRSIGYSAPRQISPNENSFDPTERRRRYEVFYKRVESIAKAGDKAAENRLEQSDIRALQFHLRKLRQAIDISEWKQAERIKSEVLSSPALQRSHVVAADSERRLLERQRADEERRHREEMRQREKLLEAEMARTRELQALRLLYGF